jgi:hypothetical protein
MRSREVVNAQARFHELWAEWQRSSPGIQEALNGSTLTACTSPSATYHQPSSKLSTLRRPRQQSLSNE